jgi:hypothetical protein
MHDYNPNYAGGTDRRISDRREDDWSKKHKTPS